MIFWQRLSVYWRENEKEIRKDRSCGDEEFHVSNEYLVILITHRLRLKRK